MSDIKQSITTAPTNSMYGTPLNVPVSPTISPATLVGSSLPATYIFEAINQDVYIIFGATSAFSEIPDPAAGKRIRIPNNQTVELFVPDGSKYVKATSLVGVPGALLTWRRKT